MTTSVRIYDDGAWVNVNDERVVGNSEIWALSGRDVCACQVGDVLLEAFFDVGVDGATVTAGVVGQCIGCGQRVTVEEVPVGRIVDGEFRVRAPRAVHRHGPTGDTEPDS